ncbi:MAG: WecB/TagA/CpsF family glycosyltransferase [Candidatus Electrothrix sp. Rat3]|nr:WecB/TagA/CpsF family glycosyltransferase [Candidatus Electrothrix rattekaaiensis]
MSKAYNPLRYDRASNIGAPVFWKKISTQFFQAMNKELSFDIVTKNLNIVSKLWSPKPSSPTNDTQQRYNMTKTRSFKAVESIELLGVRVHLLTENRLHNHIAKIIEQGRRELILNVNVHCYNMVFKNPWLKNFLNRANITFCDGAGVMLGARMMGKKKIPQRITYADWMWNFSQFAEKKGYSFFFLGAKPGVAEKAAKKLQEKYPSLEVTTHHGYFDKTAGSAENQEIIKKINASKANILVLGFGMPIQEKWLEENHDQLDVNISLTGGAVFDYLSGELKRGPRWLVDNGMEWLARILIEPKRLWKRYLVGNTAFLYKIVSERLENTIETTAIQLDDLMVNSLEIFKYLILNSFSLTPEPADSKRPIEIYTVPGSASRLNKRMELQGCYTTKIVKNNKIYRTRIKNVSIDGLQIQGVPANFDAKKEGPLIVIITNLLESIDYTLVVHPVWNDKKGKSKTAGFSIISAPVEWKQFMMRVGCIC